MNKIQIITYKNITLENLCEEEQRLFYIGILAQILELHRQEREGGIDGIQRSQNLS